MTELSYDSYAKLCRSDKEALKEVATRFCYWWYNQPGTNTEQGFEDWWKLQERCVECGARTKEDAETSCICSGDKDYCHGCELWPDA